MRAALEVEALKLRRATAARVASVAVVVGVPALAAGLHAAALGGGDSLLAAKVAPLLMGTGWGAYLGLVGQLMSVAALLAVGVVVCWSFGRELTDGTFGSLFAIPTPRRDVALAKLIVLVVWGLLLCLGAVVVALTLGVATGLGAPDGGALPGAARVVTVGGLTVLLTVPLALVSSALRGYLAGFAALLAVVVVTQVVSLVGWGAWFPYAAPGMWSGLGGPELAAGVTAGQLLLAVPVALAGAAGTAWWWARAEVV